MYRLCRPRHPPTLCGLRAGVPHYIPGKAPLQTFKIAVKTRHLLVSIGTMTASISPLHQLWRSLPQSPRRRLFYAFSELLAPRLPDPHQNLDPLIIGGMLRTATGLGEAARLCLDALGDGANVHQADLSDTILGQVELPGFDVPVMSYGPGTLILHVNAPLVPYALLRLSGRKLRDKRVIGYWFWELPDIPKEWRHGSRYVHEVWAPTRFCAEAFRQIYDGPISVVPLPIAAPRALPPTGLDSAFVVATMFNMASGFERKNPVGTVRAFRKAFGADPETRLIIKMANGSHYPEGERLLRAEIGEASNIRVISQVMSRAEVWRFLSNADAVISLHRSEGFGLLAAEGMLAGRPVISTNWSGTTDFLNHDNGIPIDCRLTPAIDPQGSYHFPMSHWAEPDTDQAADWLRRLREDRSLRAKIGSRARSDAERMFSAESYRSRVRAALAPCDF